MVLECGEEKEPECTEEMVLECGEQKECKGEMEPERREQMESKWRGEEMLKLKVWSTKAQAWKEKRRAIREERLLIQEKLEVWKSKRYKQTERSLPMEPVQSGEKALHERQEEKAVQSKEKASHKTEDEENVQREEKVLHERQEEKAVQSKEKASHKREDEKNVQREEKLFFKIAGDFQETEENSDEEGANCTEGYATSEEDFKTLLNSTDSDYIKLNGRNLSVNCEHSGIFYLLWLMVY
jgi:hypothetical protein